MDNKQVYNKLIIYFGFIFAILGIVEINVRYMIVPKSTFAGIVTILLLILDVLVFFWAVRLYKNQVGELGLGKALKLGVLAGLLGGVLVAVYAFFYYKNINPDALDQAFEISRQKSHDFGYEVDQTAEESFRNNFIPIQFLASIFSGSLFGLIGGIIGGLVYKTPTDDY